MVTPQLTKILKDRVKAVGYHKAYQELDRALAESATENTLDRYEQLHEMYSKVKILEAMFPDNIKII